MCGRRGRLHCNPVQRFRQREDEVAWRRELQAGRQRSAKAQGSNGVRRSRQRATVACQRSLRYPRTSGSGRCEKACARRVVCVGVNTLEFAPVPWASKANFQVEERMSAEWRATSDVLDVVVTRTGGKQESTSSSQGNSDCSRSRTKMDVVRYWLRGPCRSYRRAMLNPRLVPSSWAVFAMMMRRPFPCCHAASRDDDVASMPDTLRLLGQPVPVYDFECSGVNTS